MTAEDIIQVLNTRLRGLVTKTTWGETSLFYNPQNVLPNGVYFCTFKNADGENDKAANLNRENVFRFSFGLPKHTYADLFGEKPVRPSKGGVVKLNYDFTAIDQLMPHPVYAWMNWCQILNPSQASFDKLQPLIDEAYANAVNKFNKRIKQ